ncbi:MAG: NADH-quinone oxidoreductase subunit C [Bacteroidales bacterium]|nr:NADH-quinone oxidoreductase subunit C [Bacteroidales bacterium]
MTAQEIFEKLRTEAGDAVIECVVQPSYDPFIRIAPQAVFDICHSLRDDELLAFDYLMSLSATDLGDDLGVVYHLYSTKWKHKLVVKTQVPKDNPVVPSVERIWRSADWHEREAFDLLGVRFDGHHNLIRILLPYDWEGHPLRKDYRTPETYHGMKV